jgi:tetratricopeptide (TPR) repeat protein
MKKPILMLFALVALATPLAASEDCGLAKDVAGKAAETFGRDQAEGLKYFIKAQQLCPDSGAMAYNLGIAYYQYGRLEEARQNLEQAVRLDGSKGIWLNNLAAVLLELGNNQAALDTAQKAARLIPESRAVQDTLCRALVANGDFRGGLDGIRRAKNQWKDDQGITRAYEDILDAYLAHYLQEIQNGKVDSGLAGLKAAEEPEAAATYCTVLAKLGRFDEALAAADDARQRFSGNRNIDQTFNDIVDQSVRSLYLDFKAGKPGPAVSSAKSLSERYPGVPAIKTAYNELLNAFLADASSITVPEAGSRPVAGQRSGSRADALLANIGNTSAKQVDLDLTVDVDVQIPQGTMKRPYGVAVVIGNQSYARQGKRIADVTYAGRDAAVMKQYIEQVMGFDPKNIIYALDATGGELRSIFGNGGNQRGRLHNFVREGESEVFVYYVGHGAPGPDGNSAYLVPVDAEADYIANTGYPLDQFYDVLDKLPVKDVTVVLDACFSGDSAGGALFTKISPAMLKNVKPVREMENSVVFTSADKDQVATWYTEKRHSLFTYFFLKGLGGAADSNSDKKITAGEMETYLKKEVKYNAQREANRVQTPLVVGKGTSVLAQLK